MNPGENNPSTNTGVGAAPGVAGVAGGDSPAPVAAAPASLDLAGMGATPGTSEMTGLSMADTLASAQDSLTSAGMAAQTMQSDVVGLDQITASAGSATMAAPDEPLVPAAPVPGSIGSVTSVPPLNPMEQAPGMAFGGMDGAPAAAAPAGQPGIAEPAAAPYNPFAAAAAPAAPTVTQQTSSSNVPTALQPPVEKFSEKEEKKTSGKISVLTMVLGGLAVLFAVATIVFIVLWQKAENSKEVVYLEPVTQTPAVDTIALMSCSRAEQIAEGNEIAGLQSLNDLEIEASFKNDELTSVELVRGYVFENNEAAEAVRAYFESRKAALENMGNDLGVDPITATFKINGSVVTEDFKANADQLVGGYLPNLMLGDGTTELNGELKNVQTIFEGQGFTCTVE